ncbi:MAG: cell division protein FtsW [Lachnospiraceae bacterium]|nr:cell division protein FtsW [Lachnospiraceae bacterium]
MLAGREKVTRPAKHNMDYVLLTVVIFLVCFGLLMIYSASSYEAGLDFGDSAYYLKKQAFATLLGFGGMIFVANFPYKMWQRFDWLAILIAIVLLLLLKTPLGVTKNGATRWLNLGIGMTIQPAEVAKIAVIVYVASMIQRLEKINTNIIRTPKGIAIVMGPTLLIAGMIYIISKNMSSAIIVVGIAVVMIFVSVPDYKLFVIIGILGIVAVVGVVIFATQGGAGTSFRLSRVQAWLNPEAYSSDKAFQTLQALYAIGSGGIWGKGLGQSMQKRRFLPEAQNDMIFSIICEELGLFGAIIIILLFVALIWSCMVIANKSTERFGSLIVIGVMAHYAIQVILNIAVVTNTIPNTGITLPFISYGGAASLFLLAEIGLVLNVSKHCK